MAEIGFNAHLEFFGNVEQAMMFSYYLNLVRWINEGSPSWVT